MVSILQEELDSEIYPDIPGYKIKSELGRGGIATVYLAVQESLDRQVALKVMSPLLAMEPDYAERFIKEGRTVAQLSHSNIITVYDIGLQKHQLFIAMEYIAGGNMRSLMKDHINDPEWALSIAGQIALALGYAHTVGIVHRDVKPENIMFRENGAAILTDFGIAKTISSNTNLTRAGTIIGTPKYMSPEQTDGLGNDPRTDIYSLGIILYEMLTGTVPYDSENSMAVLYAHVHAPIPDLPEEINDLQPLINNLLAKKAEDRADDCDELAEIIRITRRERHYALKDPTRLLEANLTRELNRSSVERYNAEQKNKKFDIFSTVTGFVKDLTSHVNNLTGYVKDLINTPETASVKFKRIKLQIIAALAGGMVLIVVVLIWSTTSTEPETGIPAVDEQAAPESASAAPTLAPPDTSKSSVKSVESPITSKGGVAIADASDSEAEIGVPSTQEDLNSSEKNQTALLISRFLADESNDELVKQRQATAPPVAKKKKKKKIAPALSRQQKEIDNLLSSARTAIENGDIVSPTETSAVTYFNKALELSPRNRHAVRGLELSGDLVTEKAKEQYKAGRPDRALKTVNATLLLIPDHNNLLSLKNTINASFNPNSSYAKAEKLYRGVDGPRNSNRAAFYYKKAAELGHIQAMNNIGVAYADGDGVPHDDNKAMNWLKKSARLGNSEAMYNLALGYHFSDTKSPGKALTWVRQAADKEYRPAYMLIGWMTTTGSGTTASRMKAIRWDLKGMVNPISSILHSQYRIPRKWQSDFMIQYKKATNTGS